MLSRLSCAAALSLLAGPAFAQGWISDRFNNAIINVDQITSRYRDQIGIELNRIGRRPAPPPVPTAAELRAVQTADRWWAARMVQPLGEPGTPIRVSLGFLYDSALINSAQIRVFGDLPAIRDTLGQEVAGRYVPRAFAEGRAEEINDPTRNLANTRGNQRLVQREQAVEFGVRQRTITGGEYTIGQRFWNVSSNSTDYAPGQQSRARTFLTIVQPLLRDSGVAYTRSLHEVARLDANVAQMEFRRQAENHLLDVARAYWSLHLARAANLQKERAAANIRGIVGQLDARAALDADPLLISRASSALALRQADLLRARAAIRNAEARVRGLVNDPRFEQQGVGELIPNDLPLIAFEALELQTVLERAVALRPEVQQLFQQHRAAVLREGQAQIEALPRLDLVLEGNYGGRGLDSWQWGDAWQDTRRNSNNPGGMAGIRLEIPLGRDQLRAQLDRRRLETRQVESQGRATLATIIAEAEITLNEYNVAYRELAARAGVLRATARDLAIENDRWQQGVAGARGENAANALDRLLSAQERLTDSEESLTTAQVTFTLAFLALQRVQGTFTSMQNLQMQRIDDAARGPSYVFRRNATAQGSPVQPATTRTGPAR
jgi:outer membrane protein TolC